MANILASQSVEMRLRGSADQTSRQAALRKLERADVVRQRTDQSVTDDHQAVNGGFPWLEIQCARCIRLRTKFGERRVCDQQIAADVAQMKGLDGSGRPGRQYRDPILG